MCYSFLLRKPVFCVLLPLLGKLRACALSLKKKKANIGTKFTIDICGLAAIVFSRVASIYPNGSIHL